MAIRKKGFRQETMYWRILDKEPNWNYSRIGYILL
jgi:hypothetical protein